MAPRLTGLDGATALSRKRSDDPAQGHPRPPEARSSLAAAGNSDVACAANGRLPILVLDAQTRQGLAACRALGRAGFAVGAASTDPQALSRASRHVERFHHLDSSLDAASTVAATHGYAAVVALEDPTVMALRAAPPPVPTVPSLGHPIELLVDKIRLAETARAADVAYPETVSLSPQGAAFSAIARLGSPVVVKASRSSNVVDGAATHRSGARFAYDVDQVEAAARWIRDGGLEPVAQRCIESGLTVDVVLVRNGGVSEVALTYRVLRAIPLTGGIAVALETVGSDDARAARAVAALERLLDVAGYEGVANAEFCVGHDGSLTLVEVNARLWASLWFAEQLGQRVTERCVRRVVGWPSLPIAPAVPAGRRYHNLAGELSWIQRHNRRLQPLQTVIGNIRPWDVFDYVDLGDPLPPVKLAFAKAANLARGR